MKTTSLLSLAVVTTAIVSNVAAASLTNFAIGLAPTYAAQESEQIERSVKKFVLDAPMGSRIRIDDAFNLRSIVTFSVPVVRYDSPANRVRMLSAQFGALIQWFKEARSAVQSSALSNVVALRVPEYLDFVAAEGNQPRSILLIGSPLMVYATEPSFSMSGGDEGVRIPSDGHLMAPLTASPYGCAEKKGRLHGSQISWCYGNENVWQNGLAKTLVTRFWSLFAKQQGATLVSFSGDIGTVFAALSQTGLGPVANVEINANDSKIENRVARPRTVPTWLPLARAETNAVAVSPFAHALAPPARASATSALPIAPINLEVPVTSAIDIGIMWTSPYADLDLDIYGLPRPGAAELSYQKARTADGVLIKDWTQPNSRADADFEWIKMNPGVRFSEMEVWVNLFKGRGPISGRVAIHFEGRTFIGSFHIPAAHGNGGVDAPMRQNSPYWTRLDLQKILTQPQ